MSPRTGRRWTRWLAASVIVSVVLVVGGPYVYFHFIQGDAPAPLSLSTDSTDATGASTAPTTALTSVEGSFTPTSASIAGYRVKETLFAQSATAVGRTNAVTGSFMISGTTVTEASFSVDMTKVSSGRSQRDDQFQGRIMDTADFPTATFVLIQPIELGSVPADGTTVHAKATGKLTLHGVTKAVTINLDAKRAGGVIDVNGSELITFADYSIDNPSGGPASVGDSGTLEFLLVLAPKD